jgi:CHASE2 domain-containing sensor protein
MLARALHVLRTQPELVVEHLANYGELLRADVKQDSARVGHALAWAIITGAALLTFLSSAAMAILLWAVTYQQWWLLWAVPLAGACVALIGWIYLKRAWSTPVLPRVRSHVVRDFASVRDLRNVQDRDG